MKRIYGVALFAIGLGMVPGCHSQKANEVAGPAPESQMGQANRSPQGDPVAAGSAEAGGQQIQQQQQQMANQMAEMMKQRATKRQ